MHPTHDIRATRRVRLAALLMALWAVVLVLLPDDATRGGWFWAFGVVCTVLVARRTRHLPDRVRGAGRLIAAAMALSLTDGLVRTVHGSMVGREFPVPSPADVFTLAAYACTIAGILTIVRRRVGSIPTEARSDALIGGIAFAMVQWILVLGPHIVDHSIPLAARLMDTLYGVVTMLTAACGVLALVAGGHRSFANRMLGAALLCLLSLDSTTTLIIGGHLPRSAYMFVAPIVFGAGTLALLHPSSALIADRLTDANERRRVTRARIVVLTCALLTPPALTIGIAIIERSRLELLIGLAAMLLVPAVVYRLGLVVRANERMARQELVLRQTTERLVNAESSAEIEEAVRSATWELLGTRVTEVRVREAMAGTADSEPAHDVGAVNGVVSVGGVPRLVVTAHIDGVMDEATLNAFGALCREASLSLRAVEQARALVEKRSEERFGAMVSSSSDILAMLTAEGAISYVSPVAERLLGYPDGTLVGVDPAAMVHPEDRDAAVAVFTAVVDGGVAKAELRLRHFNGTFHWFEVAGRNQTHDPSISGLVLNVRAIGDRKRAEDRLSLSEARFKALVQHNSDLVIVADEQAVVRYASPSVAALLGIEPGTEEHQPLEQLLRNGPADWRSVLEEMATSPEDAPALFEFTVEDAAGGWHTIETSVADLRGERAVGGYVLNGRDITERKAMEQRLRYQATHDDLTGLANRGLVVEELGGMLGRHRVGRTVAVVLLDLDDFKDVNDSLGHAIGDELLISVAHRITTCLGYGDVAARLGGDEFAVVVERPRGENDVALLAEELLAAIGEPHLVGGREVVVSASAGIAFDHGREHRPEILLRNADAAMYRAKRDGKRRFSAFDPSLHTASADRLELRTDLAKGLADEQLRAFYQPIVELATGRIVGAEALVRWMHPRRGLLGPDMFIPLAEETGLVSELGRWMLDTATWQLRTWRDSFPQLPPDFMMSVNLSVRQLDDEGLVDRVASIVREAGIPAGLLTLEVTEQTLICDSDTVHRRLEELRAAGARLAIDDFGTGYSSLGYINRYTFDTLKIDRSFVDRLGTAESPQVLHAIMDLARRLDVRTVAEGIEQTRQADALMALGCRLGQGYLYSRPVPAEDFERLVVDHNAILAEQPPTGLSGSGHVSI